MYVLGAFAIVAALSGLFGAWEHKGKVAAEAQVSELQTKIETQNAAIQQTKAEGDRRVAEAAKGIKAATQATAKARSERDRLRIAEAQIGAHSGPGNCPAADAVAIVRAGLK